MRIRITFEVGDLMRRAIAAHYGETGLADYATCKGTIAGLAGADLETIQAGYARNQEREREDEEDVEL